MISKKNTEDKRKQEKEITIKIVLKDEEKKKNQRANSSSHEIRIDCEDCD